jgi:Glyoxalase/Bleomycin resistance protein/Dioxygenase superfamily
MQTKKQGARKGWKTPLVLALWSWIGGAVAATAPGLIVVGKTVNYRQGAHGGLTRLNYHFFAEISLPSRLRGATAQLIDPRGHVIPFHRSEEILSIPGKRDFRTLADLDGYAPDGSYGVEIDGPSGGVVKGTIPLHATEEVIADPVHVTLLQDGRIVSPDAVKVRKALTVAWSPFRKGRSDPNAIVDDLIFVHVGDCFGHLLVRTPAPFGKRPALTYRTLSYTVAANTLKAGAIYQVSVEHAPMHTLMLAGIPAAATYPVTTFLDFHTQGTGSHSCPDKPYRMDNGQSDRPRGSAARMQSEADRGIGVLSITDQATFLYYDDLTAARKFYGRTLGLTPYFETERSSLYHTTPGATIGLVKDRHNRITPAVRRAVVMVSIVTANVAGWYKKLKQDPHIHITKDLYDNPRVRIRAFEVRDPGGYPIEFFQWLKGAPRRPMCAAPCGRSLGHRPGLGEADNLTLAQ